MKEKRRGLDNRSSATILLGVLLCFVMVTVYVFSRNLDTTYAIPATLDAKDISKFTSEVETISLPANKYFEGSVLLNSKFKGKFEKDDVTYTVDLFCLEHEKGMPNSREYVKVGDSSQYIDEGITYIVNTAYKDKDFDGSHNLTLGNDEYYTIQTAIWIYQEIQKSNPENTDIANMWKALQTSHASGVAKNIYDLVVNAQSVKNSTGVNSIEVSNGNLEFALSDDKTYYETSPITVSITTKNSNTEFSGFKFELNSNVFDTTVVDESGSVIQDLNSLAGKTFKIRVNASNLNAGSESNIVGKISGIFTNNSFLAYQSSSSPESAQIALLVTSNKTTEMKELKGKITVPDTARDYSKYVYIIGAMVLVIGLSVIYVNAKAKQQ